MYNNEIQLRKEKAIQEAKQLNKSVLTDIEFFRIWNRNISGFIDMIKFKEILLENNIQVEDR